jgi:hypothetical protein
METYFSLSFPERHFLGAVDLQATRVMHTFSTVSSVREGPASKDEFWRWTLTHLCTTFEIFNEA